jgi:nicotinamidase/pyrazinamidase
MSNALIVIDMQNDFCPGGNLAVAHGDRIVGSINALMDDFDAVILTQDWHPTDHTSFADNHNGAAPFSVLQMTYGPQVLWPRHCVMGTPGAAFHRDLAVTRANMIIRKGFRAGIDSYSAFFENDHTTPTGLAGYLRERGVTQLSFVGLAHDFCGAWSAIDAAKLGFDTQVIESACRAIDMDGSLTAARDAMQAAGVTLA